MEQPHVPCNKQYVLGVTCIICRNFENYLPKKKSRKWIVY